MFAPFAATPSLQKPLEKASFLNRSTGLRSALAACAAAALLAACGKGAAVPTPGDAPALAEVGVVTTVLADVGLVTELPGRLEASRVAQVRARAAGIVQKRLFKEGSEVKSGQALFTIDSASYAAQVASAKAALAKAQANQAQTAVLAARYKTLSEANAVSKQEYATAAANQKLAEADVALAGANLQTANINLGYTAVKSPISGRIGRALVTEGALVGQGEATPLAVVQQIDPLYVNFTQSADEVMRLKTALTSGSLKPARPDGSVGVRVLLADGTPYAEEGRLLFSDLTVDASSGQVTLRAEIPNPGGQLLPGLFVRVLLSQATANQALALPQQAVTRSAQGDTVSVVNASGQVSTRTVTVGRAQGSQWVVLGGLKAGEQVVVDGFQKMQPGANVKAVPWQAPSAPAISEPKSAAAPKIPASAAIK